MSTNVVPVSVETTVPLKPLAVPVRKACELIGVGNTTMWALIKAGRVKTTSVGRRRLVIYATLEELVTSSDPAR